MIKIQIIGDKLSKILKRGEIKLCHFPNESLGWASKNMVGEVRWFNFGNNNGYPPPIVIRFSKSKSTKY